VLKSSTCPVKQPNHHSEKPRFVRSPGLLLFLVRASSFANNIVPSVKPRRNFVAPRQAIVTTNGGMRQAVRYIGPFPLVLIAFAAGVLASRR
jgi:hypothetical protein